MSDLRCPGCFEPGSLRVTLDKRGFPTGFCAWCRSRYFLTPESLAVLDAGQAARTRLVDREGGPRVLQARALRPDPAAPRTNEARCPCCGEAGAAMVRLDRHARPYWLSRCRCRVRAFVGLPVGLTSILLSSPGVAHVLAPPVERPEAPAAPMVASRVEEGHRGLG